MFFFSFRFKFYSIDLEEKENGTKLLNNTVAICSGEILLARKKHEGGNLFASDIGESRGSDVKIGYAIDVKHLRV